MRKYLHVWHISFDRRRVEMLLESFRGEQIKNAPDYRSTLPSPHPALSLSPSLTNANRRSACSTSIYFSRIDNVKAVAVVSPPFAAAAAAFLNISAKWHWIVSGPLKSVALIHVWHMWHVARGMGQPAISTGCMINAQQLTIQGKSCRTIAQLAY